ncbi:MAG: AAA domain-containing protein [Syntrophobacteraceae bacterium]
MKESGRQGHIFQGTHPGESAPADKTQNEQSPLLHRLAKYYRDLLFSLYSVSSVGKHFVDVSAVLRYKLTADLGLFIENFEKLIEGTTNKFSIDKLSAAAISKTIMEGAEKEESDQFSGNGNGSHPIPSNQENALKDASAAIIAIYRRQQFDPFNREVIIGFPLISGQINGRKYCAPLLYFTARIDFDPLRNIVDLTKDYSIPALNFHFLKQILKSDEEIEMVRNQIIIHLYENDFGVSTITDIVGKLSNLHLVEELAGITFDPNGHVDLLSEAINWRDKQPPKIFNSVVIVNANRSNPYLLDDLARLSKLEVPSGLTAVDRILNPPPDRELAFEFEHDPATVMEAPPLLYPLKSNRAQRTAAVKAENAQLMVIQGPPGTGKSQTIVNLVCHLISQGKTVLVSSHQNKALEIITKNLPQVDYLAMSLFKGEKQSLADLLTKIQGFSSYTSGRGALDLYESLDKMVGKLKQKDIDIKRLSARFSELKKLERDKNPMYRRYSDLRHHELISESDSIPEGMDSRVAGALGSYNALLDSIGGNLSDLITLFSDSGLNSSSLPAIPDGASRQTFGFPEMGPVSDESVLRKSTTSNNGGIKAVKDGIGKLVEAHEWVHKHMLSNNSARNLCKALAAVREDNGAMAGQLLQLSTWAAKHLPNLERSLKMLAIVHGIEIDLPKVRVNVLKYAQIINQVSELTARVRERLSAFFTIVPDGAYPNQPDESVLTKVAQAIGSLEASMHSWWSWKFSPKARTGRKELLSANITAFPYAHRKESLESLKSWGQYWTSRKEVVASLTGLAGADFPFDAPQKNASVQELTELASIAEIYNAVMDAFVNYPSSVDTRLTSHIDNEIPKNKGADRLQNCLAALTTYIGYMDEITKYKQNSHFTELCESTLSPLVRTFVDIEDTLEASKTVSWLKNLQNHFSSYMNLVELEQDPLKTLPTTCKLIKNQFMAGVDVPQLKDPVKVVEAFRLSGLVREDLIKNPDDINEIASRIVEIKTEIFQDILKALDLHRKFALKKASSNPATIAQVSKLKQVLKRKRKTHSFMHLRDQIDYEKLLTIFPCWIMSIDDVGRIFPLQASLFDYLIVDEASQCNQAAVLPLAFRAKRMIVVGDDKQMKNPNTQFLSDTVVQLHLTKHRLDTHPNEPFLRGRNSLLDLALGCQDIEPVFLNEHFRSEPPIIQFSNEHFYDTKLRILTPFRRKRFTSCMEVRFVPGAFDDPDETHQNVVEAKAVVGELVDLVNSGQLEGDNPGEYFSVGVLSLFRPQATLLQNLVYEAFADQPDLIQRHSITVSTVDGFQGDERDIILYSFRYASNSKPSSINAVQRTSDEHSVGRLNVAFTRAKRKVICFTSTPVEHFPRGLVRDYLEYVTVEQKHPKDRLGSSMERQKCQSEFERHVFDDLARAGLIVYTQVPCAGFFIDFVVFDVDGRRLAVECDGDFHYEDGELREEDYQRQDIIERYGWVVHRIPSRRYYSRPKKTVKEVLEALSQQAPDKEVTIRAESAAQGYYGEGATFTMTVPPEENVEQKEGKVITTNLVKEPMIRFKAVAAEEKEAGIKRVEFNSMTAFQHGIMELLTNEGEMPIWRISDMLNHQDKYDIQKQLNAMELQGWVERTRQKGVKVWRAMATR